MKIDSQEITQLLQAEAAAAPRVDLYGPIHKAMRAMLADSLLALGRMDAGDAAEIAATCERVDELLQGCAAHLRHENRFVHPAIEARAPGVVNPIADDHQAHEREIVALQALTARLREDGGGQAAELAQALYARLGLFMAHNLEHMRVEETVHNAALWAHYSDAELGAIHDALLASIEPPEMMTTLRWMLPAMNPAERAGMLGAMRQQAPAPAFQAVLDLARAHLSGGQWAKLAAALDLSGGH